jgi:hypothetical protein
MSNKHWGKAVWTWLLSNTDLRWGKTTGKACIRRIVLAYNSQQLRPIPVSCWQFPRAWTRRSNIARRANCGVPWLGKNVEPWTFGVYVILPASLDLQQPAKDTGYDTFSPCAPFSPFRVDDRLVVEGISTWRSAAWRVLPGLPSRDWHVGLQKPPDNLWFVRGEAKAGLRPGLVRGRQDPHSRWWTWNKNNLLAIISG